MTTPLNPDDVTNVAVGVTGILAASGIIGGAVVAPILALFAGLFGIFNSSSKKEKKDVG